MRIMSGIAGDLAERFIDAITQGDKFGKMIGGIFTLPTGNPPAYACEGYVVPKTGKQFCDASDYYKHYPDCGYLGTTNTRNMTDTVSTDDKTTNGGFCGMYDEMARQREAMEKMVQLTEGTEKYDYNKREFELGGVSQSELQRRIDVEKEAIDAYQRQLEGLDENSHVAKQLTAQQESATAAMIKYQMQLDYLTGAINSLTYAISQPTTGSAASGAGGGGSGSGGGFSTVTGSKWKGSSGKLYGSEAEAVANSQPKTIPDGKGDTKPNPNYKPAVQVNAEGTVIDEEIQGVGKQTGKRYSFGEAGDEAIVPINKFYAMAAALKRIGLNKMIPSSLQQEGVGQFTGVSGFGIQRQYDKMQELQESMAGAKEEYGPRVESAQADYDTALASRRPSLGKGRYVNKYGKRRGSRPSRSKMKRHGIAMRKWGERLNAAQSKLTKAKSGFNRYDDPLTEAEGLFTEMSGSFGDSGAVQAIGGTKTRERPSGAATWNNSINITVSDSSGNIDNIIQQKGTKLLEYIRH